MSADVQGAAIVRPSPKVAPAEPRPRHKWEAADTVIAISIGLVALIIGIFVLLCVQGYYTTLESTKTRGQTAADIVAKETSWVVSSALTLALGAGGAFNWDPSQASAVSLGRFGAVTALMPTKLSVGVYDATGKIITDASSPNVPRDIADRDYFQSVSTGADWAISGQEVDAADGKAIFAVVRKLAPQGQFLGAVMIAVDARVLEDFAGPLNLGADSTVSIVRNDGWIIARNPSLTEPSTLKGRPSFESINSGDSGSFVSLSPNDNLTRMVSFRRVDDLGYVALASISVQTALGGLWYSIIIVSALLAPIAIALLIGSFITARLVRRTQATSRSLTTALADNEVLFREIHHRVKNNLQSVGSLLQMQPIPKEIKLDMGQRIAAMSAVHEHIYRSNTFSRVEVKDYLHTLVENIRAGHNPDVRLTEDIENVAVEKDTATPLGLIFNEVVSNAFKHAFSDGRQGSVTIKLKRLDDGRGELCVSDNGVGFDPEQPVKGIGRRLITALTQQVQGESRFVSAPGSGATFTLVFPLASPGTGP